MSNLYDVGDASAQEKYYHTQCIRYAQRTCTLPVKNQTKLIWNICDEELLNSIQNTLNDGNTLNISEVYDAYVSIVKKYHGNIEVTTYWKQYLKKLINDNLPNVQFVKSMHKKPEHLVMKEKFTEAIEILSKDSAIGLLKNEAKILRDETLDPCTILLSALTELRLLRVKVLLTLFLIISISFLRLVSTNPQLP